MFKKYYKEANDSIKPDEAFVNKVIQNVTRQRPPLYARYTKYAAIAAAAVIIISGAAASMPLWQRADDNTDGIITEEIVTDNADSEQDKTDAPKASSEPKFTPFPEGRQTNNSSKSKSISEKTPSQNKTNTPETAFGEAGKNEPTREAGENNIITEDIADEAAPDITADTGGYAEDSAQKKAVAGAGDYKYRAPSAPQDMAPFTVAYNAASAQESAEEIADSDIPVPDGYYCVRAVPNGYTFVNDNGAVIDVVINYGGEEREPYIEENGDNIYAVFTSFGLSVTINSSGADRSVVEEIIYSLR